MSAWLIWLIIVLAICGLAWLKVGIHIVCNEDFSFWIVIGKLKFTLQGKDKAPSREKETNKNDGKPDKKDKKKDQKSEKIKPWIKTAVLHRHKIFSLIGRILTAPTLDILKVYIGVGDQDPEKCAITYGRICGAIGGLLGPVESTFKIKKRDIQVFCCFDRDKLQINAEAKITIRIYEIIALAAALLRLGLSLYREVNTNMKVVENV